MGPKYEIEAGATGLDSTMQGLTWERAECTQRRTEAHHEEQKKEEFPGLMGNMPPGNSFPQICVVTVFDFPDNQGFAQDYGRSVDLSNIIC
jgi:hypothetical protein